MDLVVESYKLARLLPPNQTFGLASQIQRGAASTPANVAEGHGREHLGDYLYHLSVANGSLMELETHFHVGLRLSYFDRARIDAVLKQTAELGRMLAGLIRSLKRRASDT
jgi:four helix bundle protein